MLALALLSLLSFFSSSVSAFPQNFRKSNHSLARREAEVLLEIDDARGTLYYDVTETSSNDVCATQGAMEQKGWATNINTGIPECSYYSGDSLNKLGTSQIVALNWNLLGGSKPDPSLLPYWCGKEVLIFDSAGSQVTIDEGPFYLWDGCQACTTAPIIDLSALAVIAINGNCDSNPTGLKIQVIDNNVVQPESASALTPSSTSFNYGDVQSVPVSSLSKAQVPGTTIAPISSTATTKSASYGGSCSAGSFQCAGKVLQECNNVGTAWVTLDTCATSCTVNGAVPTCI